MRVPKPSAELYEGYVMIEVVDEFGRARYDFKNEGEVGKPAVASCCHRPPDESPEVFVVIGKIVDGKINGEPLKKWLPFLRKE